MAKARVSGEDHSRVGRSVRNSGPDRIFQDVSDETLEGVTTTLLRSQNPVVGLVLEATVLSPELVVDLPAQPAIGEVEIGRGAGPHPDEVQMIRHQAIGRAEKLPSRCRMQKDLAEPMVKLRIEPPR